MITTSVTPAKGDAHTRGSGPKRTLAAAAMAVLPLFSMTSPNIAQAQPEIRNLTEQEAVDMVVGTGIYCSRAGDTQGYIEKVKTAFKAGKTLQMISIEELPDSWMGVQIGGLGGGDPWPEVVKRYAHLNLKGFDPDQYDPEKTLSEYIGKPFQALYSVESGQFTSALLRASKLGIPLIDGDPTARCVPEVPMTFVNGGVPWAPIAGQTMFGDTFIFTKVRDAYRVEDMARALAIGSGGGVFLALNPLTGAVLKKNLAPNFHSQAGRLGRAAREAVAAKKDPVAAVVATGNGYLLFTGKVTKSDTKGDRGFSWADVEIAGSGKFSGSTYRIYNKNENMVAWRDDKFDAAAPDIIALLDPRTGWAIQSEKLDGYPLGIEVAVVGIPAVPMNRTAKAAEVMGPRHFGFDIDFVPLEKLHGKATH